MAKTGISLIHKPIRWGTTIIFIIQIKNFLISNNDFHFFTWWIKCLKHIGICTTALKLKNSAFCQTDYAFDFDLIHRLNDDYFSNQRWPISICNGEAVRFVLKINLN
jgi:hypothetical protein